jgi:hypothetical protein
MRLCRQKQASFAADDLLQRACGWKRYWEVPPKIRKSFVKDVSLQLLQGNVVVVKRTEDGLEAGAFKPRR